MRFDAIILADSRNLWICPIGLAVAPDTVRVAIEVKHLMGALGGPHEYLGAPKDPPGGLKLLKMNIKEKKSKNWTESITKTYFLADSTVK